MENRPLPDLFFNSGGPFPSSLPGINSGLAGIMAGFVQHPLIRVQGISHRSFAAKENSQDPAFLFHNCDTRPAFRRDSLAKRKRSNHPNSAKSARVERCAVWWVVGATG